MFRRLGFFTLVVLFLSPRVASAAGNSDALADGLRPFLEAISGKQSEFTLSGDGNIVFDGETEAVEFRLAQFDQRSFDLELIHSDYEITLRRRADTTAFALPKHKVVFIGRGDVAPGDCLKPAGITQRLLSPGSKVSGYAAVLQQGDPETIAILLTGILQVQQDAASGDWTAGEDVSFRFGDRTGSVEVEADEMALRLQVEDSTTAPAAVDQWPEMRLVEIERRELERQLVRGVRRALEILAPSSKLRAPEETPRQVANGRLRWINGQRVALLHGTPEEIGRAHGELLQQEAQRCIDSVLYTFGTAQTIRTGRWFAHDLAAAYKRLAPHIPADHKRETRAMAESLGIEPQLAETLNVFPELFHCSGFAVFDTATKDGKLYHGRVLDYMTTIGLQDAATTFVVAVDGKIPFTNVGYAGFIGSVSGMNSRAISLGEMGGRGEGEWDGVPMATLMRRALEECSSLDDVMHLWKSSPRTCEYYYVFADGKTNDAVGVAATPESIEFIHPGESHPLLGEGIEDAVVLSAGSRLEKLRQRVTSRHGSIDTEAAKWLMSRPVAMQSNLHNVLFVPSDGVLYVANASHNRPAAERPYVRIDLHELLDAMQQPLPAAGK